MFMCQQDACSAPCSVTLEEPLAWQQAPGPLLPLVPTWADTHRGKMVEVLSWRVLAWHRWRVWELLPLVKAVVHGGSHRRTVLVSVHGAGRAQRPRPWLGVQPLSGSLRGGGRDIGESPKGSRLPPPPLTSSELSLQQETRARRTDPSPSTQEGFFPHPHLFVLFQQLLQLLLLLLLPLAVILGCSQLEAMGGGGG